jgi:hypothetical protein
MEQEASFFKKFVIYGAMLTLSMGTLLGIGYYAYSFTVKPIDIDELPIIRKPSIPVRVRPEDPGGLTVLNQDKAIFDEVTGRTAGKRGKIHQYYLQLGTFSSRRAAEQESERLIGNYEILQDSKLLVVPGSQKGQYFLITTNMNKIVANKLCHNLKEQDQSCVIVKDDD